MKSRRRRSRRNPSRRRRTVSRRRIVRRRRRSAPAVRRVVRRRRRRSAPVFAVARRSRRRSMVVSRRRRRSGRSSGLSLGSGGLLGSFKQIGNKQTLTIAGGAVASGILSTMVLTKFGGAQPVGGFSLPGSSSPYGQIAYQLAIPFGAAYLIRRVSPDLAKGFVLGGVIAAIHNIVALAMAPSATAGTGAYLSQPMAALPPGYAAVDAFGASIYSSEPAFAQSAWGGN